MLELLLALPFVLAVWVLLARNVSRRTTAWLAGAAPLLGLVLLGALTAPVLGGEVPQVSHAWIPQIGLAFSLRLDGLAWMFALMVLAIGGLVVMYAHYYLGAREDVPKFFAYLLLFMGAMLGMVLAGNLLLLTIFWELTSISSFLLIGYWSHQKEAREGARMALTITGAGGLALLGGVLLIGQIVGSFELDAVFAAGDAIRAHATYPAILGLVLLAIFTKSAQFPFHFWLPHAMAAPTPVSAYLHSATMVKAGVFLLARLHPTLAGTDLFFYVVSSVGAITVLIGAWHAIFQHDLKGLLAYSTISHLGLITLLFGLSTPLAVVAGLFHIINHATFKASLFMAAGIIDHETGTRDMRRLGNLRRHLPFTSALAIIATLAMAGIPLLNGFLSKEMFFAQALEIEGHGSMQVVITIAAFLAGVFGVAYSLRFVHDTFFGAGPRAVDREIHEPPRFMKIPVEVLVVLCLAVGIVPAYTVAPVLAAAAHGVLGEATPEYSLALWHGFNLPLLMSLGGLIGGVTLYFGLRRLFDLHAIARRAFGRRVFWANADALLGIARRATLKLTNGSLQRSLWWVLATLVVIAIVPALSVIPSGLQAPDQPLPLVGWALWAILVAATGMTVVLHRQRLLALIVLGAVGLGVSVVFVFLSAPDLALTQLLVELVTVALMLLALNYLPKESVPSNSRARRWRDGAIALMVGGGIGGLAYAMMTRPADTIASELLARSLPEAYGSNVVNVILVDFRGFDTLGEITVFGIAGLVVHALLRRVRIRAEEVIPGEPDRLPMPANLSHLLFPFALAVSVYLFLRGHNAPGGGFIAGLVLAIPLLLQYVLLGSQYVESRMGFDYTRCIGVGLLVALLTGVAPMLLGYPFLTSGHVEPWLPLIGELPLTSALGFDIGVYLVVFGGAMLILSMMGTIKPPLPRAAAGRVTADPAAGQEAR
ncbi:monovalent cation/H+ antiporter subunit A [Lysobacter sp. D1-1-M9]|uniref:monovalent cation/H+ antiporter subunit A n=2 Tax=Novilysobacter TaxID=3382699 RepID=UPI002FC8D750